MSQMYGDVRCGDKCPDCVKQTTSHIVQIDNKHVVIALITSALMGHAFGWLHPFLPQIYWFYFFGIPVLGLVIAFLAGRFAGQVIRCSVQYKTGKKLSRISAISALIGTVLSPLYGTYQEWIFFVNDLITNPYMGKMGTSIEFLLVDIIVQIALVGLFIKGLQKAYE